MSSNGTATIIRGDARHIPLADASVDLIVTSPPYYQLRAYTDGGEHYDGQIGAEPTPAEYIDALIECTREWVRVLKPSGSLFLNLGDKYNSAASGQNLRDAAGRDGRGPKRHDGGRGHADAGIPTKSLMLLPERYRIAAVDRLGLIARAVIVWDKPNPMPESVTDRVKRSHEDWVHLTKQPRYYSAVDTIRTPASDYTRTRNAIRTTPPPPGNRPRAMADTVNPLGGLPGSVWEIPTEPLIVPEHLGVDHFAAFPTEWPRRIILGWSPSGICTACGEGRRPVVAIGEYRQAGHGGNYAATPYAPSRELGGHHGHAASSLRTAAARVVTGEACACPDASASTRPATVLDPFSGTGTTVLVASALGRHGVGVDRSADYCRLAAWRTTDPGQVAKAMRVPAPPKQIDGQSTLFDAHPSGVVA